MGGSILDRRLRDRELQVVSASASAPRNRARELQDAADIWLAEYEPSARAAKANEPEPYVLANHAMAFGLGQERFVAPDADRDPRRELLSVAREARRKQRRRERLTEFELRAVERAESLYERW